MDATHAPVVCARRSCGDGIRSGGTSPTGVQVDVPASSILTSNQGARSWTAVHTSTYNQYFRTTTWDLSAFPGDAYCVFIGAQATGSSTIAIGAFLDKAVVRTETVVNTPVLNRGTWYHYTEGITRPDNENYGSMGISETSVISQGNADMNVGMRGVAVAVCTQGWLWLWWLWLRLRG